MNALHRLAPAILVVSALVGPDARAADEVAPNQRPVKAIADARIAVGAEAAMLTSSCGLKALFDLPGCEVGQ
jgi:hypothetical protein